MSSSRNNNNNSNSASQQQRQGSRSRSSSSSSSSSPLRQVVSYFILLLRAVLWPLHRLSSLLFPPHEFDGLEDAITAKASRQFVTYLKSLADSSSSSSSSSNTGNSPSSTNAAAVALSNTISNVWVSNAGFAQIKQDAVQSQSLMLLYLHSPLHRQATHFCKTVLCDARLLDLLQQNQQPAQTPAALGVSIHTAQGAYLANLLQATAYPVLALLYPKTATQLSLVFSAQGPVLTDMSLNRLLSQLQLALQRHLTVVTEQNLRTMQREQEAELRRQQDAEYQQALAEDQERERQAQAQEEEQRQEEQAKELELALAKSLIQPEPASNGEDVTSVRFVLPSGTKLNRRFGSSESFAAVRAFIRLHFTETLQVPPGTFQNIGLSSHFPRREYNDCDDQTLNELGLGGQAVVLMVQDLDA